MAKAKGAAELATAVRRVEIDVVGFARCSVDVLNAGSKEMQANVHIGDCLIKTRSENLAWKVSDVLRTGLVHLPHLAPFPVPGWLSEIGPLVALVMDANDGNTGTSLVLMPADPHKPGHVRLQVGPVTWRVWDRVAYQRIYNAWHEVSQQFARA